MPQINVNSTQVEVNLAAFDLVYVANLLDIPEEKVASLITESKLNGLDDARLETLRRQCEIKGLSNNEIARVYVTIGASRKKIIELLELENNSECQAKCVKKNKKACCREDEEYANADSVQENLIELEKRQKSYIAWCKKAGIVGFWICLWQLLDHIVDNRLALAGPLRVAEALVELASSSQFWAICGASCLRIASGFLLSFFVAIALATLANKFRIVRDFLEPFMSFLRTAPVVSFIIMLLIWVGNQVLTVYLAFFIVLPIIYTNTLMGFDTVNKQMLEMADVFGLSRWRRLVYIYRPVIMPFLNSGTKIALGMSWRSGIMAELLALPNPSIGKEMAKARTFLNTPDLLAWTVVVMLLSWLFNKAFFCLLQMVGKPWGERLEKRNRR